MFLFSKALPIEASELYEKHMKPARNRDDRFHSRENHGQSGLPINSCRRIMEGHPWCVLNIFELWRSPQLSFFLSNLYFHWFTSAFQSVNFSLVTQAHPQNSAVPKVYIPPIKIMDSKEWRREETYNLQILAVESQQTKKCKFAWETWETWETRGGEPGEEIWGS